MTAIVRRLSEWVTAIADRYSVLGIALDAFQKFNAHESMPRAAAIAYYSVLSLFPFAIIALVAVSLLLPEGPELNAFVARVADAFALEPEAVFEALDAFEDSRLVFALVGIGFLLLALLPWVSAVQRGIVRAFEEERRSYARTTVSSLLLLGLAGVLILLSGVWASLVSLVIGVIDRFLPEIALVDFTLSLFVVSLPTLVVFAVMAALLRAIPMQDPTFREVWLGALVTALGFFGLSLVFDWYVALFVADSGNATGPFGAILVGLLYIDFLAIAMLAGAEVAAATTRRHRARLPDSPAST
ncbi:MAG: YihY/virulence factor BrkB family protein [Chloroflexi bacterium]|nr:MAG: YihY/virulence factor BrkB family protein [Chloroflexota bacterium]